MIKIGESQTSFLRRALDEALEEKLKEQENPQKPKPKVEAPPLLAQTPEKPTRKPVI